MIYYFNNKHLAELLETVEHMRNRRLGAYDLSLSIPYSLPLSIKVECPNLHVEDFVNYMKMKYHIKPFARSQILKGEGNSNE